MSKVSDITDSKWLKWKATSVEWLSVIIACAASMIALVSMFMTAICIGVIWSQESRIDDLSGDIDVYRIRAAKLNAYLAAHGINPEDIYDE